MTIFDDRAFAQTLLAFAKLQKNDSKIELEFRFSSKLQNFPPGVPIHVGNAERPHNFRFAPTVHHHNYMMLFEYFSSQYTGKVCSTIERSFPKGIREIVDLQTGERTYMAKNRVRFHDFYPWNLRISACKEEAYTGPPPDEKSCTFTREKYRVRFHIGECMHVDLTRVKSSNQHHEQYEVELEYTGKTFSPKELGGVTELCQLIFKRLQDSESIVSYGELFNTTLEYEMLTKSSGFIGSLPDALHGGNMALLKAGPYMVTIKYDGVRCLLFMSDNDRIYRLGRSHQWSFTGLGCSLNGGTILDAEYIKSTDTYHVFDILFYRGCDLRGKTEYSLKARIDLVNSICNDMKQEKLVPKKYYDTESFDTSTYEQECSRVPCDGVVFVPANETYPMRKRWATMLKWKPVHTLDLLVKVGGDNIPFVYGSNGKDSGLFLVGRLETLGQQVVPNTVVECSFNGSTFDYIKTRFDKLFPNAKPAVEDALNATKNVIGLDAMFGRTPEPSTCKPSRSNGSRLKAAHGIVKRTLIETAAGSKAKLRVLELGCGRGGDIYKWDHLNRPVELVGVDVNESFIAEAQNRIKTSPPKNVKVKFVECDLTKENPAVSGKFDIVSCQFALHHFFDSAETTLRLLQFVADSLKQGGQFIVTTLDGNRVLQHMNEHPQVQSSNRFGFGISSIFPVKTLVQNAVMRSYGAKINVKFTDPSFITNLYENAEYLVFPDTLITDAQKCGLKLTSTDVFQPSPDSRLDAAEEMYSVLNRWYIFQKSPRKTSMKTTPVAMPDCVTIKDLDCKWNTLMNHLAIFLGSATPGMPQNLEEMTMDDRIKTLRRVFPAFAFSILDGKHQTVYVPEDMVDQVERVAAEYSHIVLTKQGALVFHTDINSNGLSVTHSPPQWLMEHTVSSEVRNSRQCVEHMVTFNGKSLRYLDDTDKKTLESSECALAKAILGWIQTNTKCADKVVVLKHTWN